MFKIGIDYVPFYNSVSNWHNNAPQYGTPIYKVNNESDRGSFRTDDLSPSRCRSWVTVAAFAIKATLQKTYGVTASIVL